ncbi:fumarylacetoacetate hydrolase [Platysternon megacephalum]|uniref:Fumarylacetoacetate hydrolase n=1 Tax=Platysternon megacephalum TaxID=55544 RepID=A0A4D9DLF3_9SAUR|nr:fumarylacetoacetate hydrolase [Platysternon megacephalum]
MDQATPPWRVMSPSGPSHTSTHDVIQWDEGYWLLTGEVLTMQQAPPILLGPHQRWQATPPLVVMSLVDKATPPLVVTSLSGTSHTPIGDITVWNKSHPIYCDVIKGSAQVSGQSDTIK